MSKEPAEKLEEGQLSLKGRINFEYLLGAQIAAYQFVLKGEEFKEAQVKEVIKGFVDIMPANWRDKDFKEDLKKAVTKMHTDIRPLVAGNIRLDVKICEKLGIPTTRTEETFNYRAIMQACINLLDRRKLLSKVNPVEELDYIELEKIGESEGVKVRPRSLQSK